MVKKIPIRIRFWAQNIARPLRRTGIRKRRKLTSGGWPVASRRLSQARKATNRPPPAAITNGASENPNGSTGELRGSSQPQLLACRTPKTISPSPSAESTEPTQSSPAGRSSDSGSRSSRTASRIAITSTTSPTKTTRQEAFVVSQPPRIGPTAIPAPATPPRTP